MIFTSKRRRARDRASIHDGRAAAVRGAPVELTVNGRNWRGVVEPGEMLLHTLRHRMGLTAAKTACGRGECGACTVLVSDRPRMACISPVVLVDGPVLTAEGLAEESRSLRRSFAEHGAFQCGFCTPGQIVAGCAIVRTRDSGCSESDVRSALNGNICRCTGYTSIVDSIVSALRGSDDP